LFALHPATSSGRKLTTGRRISVRKSEYFGFLSAICLSCCADSDDSNIPSANLTAAAKAAVEKASQEAAVATQNAEDAHGALDSAVQSQTAAHTIARLKQKVEQLTKEKPKGTADIKAKKSQMRQLRRDQNKKKKEARKAKSTSKKLAKKSEKEYAKTQNEISQLSGKIAKAKGNYEAAQKEEDAANKQAEENENNVAKKATATIQAQEKLEDVTKASDQLSKVKDSDVDVPHMRL